MINNEIDYLKKINKDLPLSFPKLDSLIEDIKMKLPDLSKSDVTLLVRCLIEFIRDTISIGKKISISKFLNNTYLSINKNKNNSFRIKVNIKTP